MLWCRLRGDLVSGRKAVTILKDNRGQHIWEPTFFPPQRTRGGLAVLCQQGAISEIGLYFFHQFSTIPDAILSIKAPGGEPIALELSTVSTTQATFVVPKKFVDDVAAMEGARVFYSVAEIGAFDVTAAGTLQCNGIFKASPKQRNGLTVYANDQGCELSYHSLELGWVICQGATVMYRSAPTLILNVDTKGPSNDALMNDSSTPVNITMPTAGFSLSGITIMVNGNYKKTSKTVHGKPVYEKVDDSTKSFFYNADGYWMVAKTENVEEGGKTGLAYVPTADLSTPLETDGKTWKSLGDDAWVEQSSVSVVELTATPTASPPYQNEWICVDGNGPAPSMLHVDTHKFAPKLGRSLGTLSGDRLPPILIPDVNEVRKETCPCESVQRDGTDCSFKGSIDEVETHLHEVHGWTIAHRTLHSWERRGGTRRPTHRYAFDFGTPFQTRGAEVSWGSTVDEYKRISGPRLVIAAGVDWDKILWEPNKHTLATTIMPFNGKIAVVELKKDEKVRFNPNPTSICCLSKVGGQHVQRLRHTYVVRCYHFI